MLPLLARDQKGRAPAPFIAKSSSAHAATNPSVAGLQGGNQKSGEEALPLHNTKTILDNALTSFKVLFGGCTKCGRSSTNCPCPSGKHYMSCGGMSCKLVHILIGSVFAGRKSTGWPLWGGHQRLLTAKFCTAAKVPTISAVWRACVMWLLSLFRLRKQIASSALQYQPRCLQKNNT